MAISVGLAAVCASEPDTAAAPSAIVTANLRQTHRNKNYKYESVTLIVPGEHGLSIDAELSDCFVS